MSTVLKIQGTPATPSAVADDGAEKVKINSTQEAADNITPELVIALCGPIGSPLHHATKQIVSILTDYEYKCVDLRLSNLIRINAGKVAISIDESSKFTEISSLIKAGDALRNKHGNDILAKLAIANIMGDRTKQFDSFQDTTNEAGTVVTKKVKNHRICHIIDSIKNKSELELLRLVYGDLLFAIGVFSPVDIRSKNLISPDLLSEEEANKLFDTDSGEEFDHGQSVRDTFPKCDFFCAWTIQ